MSIEPGQIRSECYTNDVTEDGEFDYCNTAVPLVYIYAALMSVENSLKLLTEKFV